MKKSKRVKESNKNIRLGLYFGLVVIFIVLVSFTFKIFDNIKKSTFDSGNFFTVAIFSEKNTQLISVSPKENSIKKITINGIKSDEALNNLNIPYDNLANSKEELSLNPKTYFTKMLFRQNDLKSSLTTIDLIKLSIYSNKVSSENITEDSVELDDEDFEKILSSWFLDPEILNEDLKIEIVNTTDISGLGNKFADLITKAGGNVVLVHSSADELNNSVIYFNNDSYTVKKLSSFLDISSEKKELNSVSDIVVYIGSDIKE